VIQKIFSPPIPGLHMRKEITVCLFHSSASMKEKTRALGRENADESFLAYFSSGTISHSLAATGKGKDKPYVTRV